MNIIFIKYVCLNRFTPFLPSLPHIISCTHLSCLSCYTLIHYVPSFPMDQSRVFTFSLLYIRYTVMFLSSCPPVRFYIIRHPCLQTYSIINMYRRCIAHPSTLAVPLLSPLHARYLPLPPPSLRILYTFCISSCVLPYVYTNVAAIFIPPPPPHYELIPRPRSLCISKRTYALMASSTIS